MKRVHTSVAGRMLLMTVICCAFVLPPARAVTTQPFEGSSLQTAVPMHSSKSVNQMFRHSGGHRTAGAFNPAQMYKTGSAAGNAQVLTYQYSAAQLNSYNSGKSGSTAGVRLSGGSSSAASGGSYAAATYSSPSVATMKASVGAVGQQSVTLVARRSYGEPPDDGYDYYWDDDEEEWKRVEHELNETKYEDGKWWRWNGSAWVEMTEEPPYDEPVGDAPVCLLILLVTGYVSYTLKRKKALKATKRCF